MKIDPPIWSYKCGNSCSTKYHSTLNDLPSLHFRTYTQKTHVFFGGDFQDYSVVFLTKTITKIYKLEFLSLMRFLCFNL